MLSCKQITELLTDYVEGRMSFWQRLSFQMHVGMCIHCRRYLRQVRATIKTLGGLEPEQIPDDVKEDLMVRFRDWKRAEA